jgi:Protein of unknown function (DUF2510)
MGEAAAWYPDPTGRYDHRYWDGEAWTAHAATQGVQSADPVSSSYPPPGSPLLLRPLGIGECLDAGITLYRTRFLDMVKAVAVVTVPIQVLSILVSLSLPRGSDATADSRAWASVAGVLLVALVGVVATGLASAASFKIISDAYLGMTTGWRASLRFGLARLGPVVWLTVLHLVLLLLAFVACILPGVWLYAAWAVATPALLFENVRGRRALGRSLELVRGRWWPVAATLLITTLVVSLASGVFTSIITLPLTASLGSGDPLVVLVRGVVSGAASVLTVPFRAAIVAVLYFDLRVRKEGFDIQLMAQRIGTEASEPDDGLAGPTRP